MIDQIVKGLEISMAGQKLYFQAEPLSEAERQVALKHIKIKPDSEWIVWVK